MPSIFTNPDSLELNPAKEKTYLPVMDEVSQSFQGDDVLTGGGRHRRNLGAHSLSVQVHGACPTLSPFGHALNLLRGVSISRESVSEGCLAAA